MAHEQDTAQCPDSYHY